MTDFSVKDNFFTRHKTELIENIENQHKTFTENNLKNNTFHIQSIV